jgi:hypothetical protein
MTSAFCGMTSKDDEMTSTSYGMVPKDIEIKVGNILAKHLQRNFCYNKNFTNRFEDFLNAEL